MSANLFEIQRIWDVWPNIQNQQVFRELFRQLSTDDVSEVTDVFVIPGHVFVATSTRSHAKLYAFSCTLKNFKAQDEHATSSLLQLGEGCSKVVNVISGGQQGVDQRIYVVQDNGQLAQFGYCVATNAWKSLECLSLSSFNVHSCIFNASTSDFILCEMLPTSNSTNSYQIVARRQTAVDEGSFALAEARLVLTHAPPLQLLGYRDGVCFVPSAAPYPNGLLLFWAFDEQSKSDILKPYIWNSTSTVYDFNVSEFEPFSFRDVALRTAKTWSKTVRDPCLVSVTVNPLTNQLLALAGDGVVYTLIAPSQGQPERHRLTKLSDFSHRQSSITSLYSFPSPPASMLIFTLHTFIGLFIKGEIRLYDAFTGEFLWESDEHEGSGSTLWTMPTTPNFCGLYDSSGVWLMRGRKAVDQANFMANALFPISTNADETTPGDYLENGQILSAKMCKLWGLKLWGVKYIIEAGFEKIKGNIEGKQVAAMDSFIPKLPPDLITLLCEETCLQNPALLVALLTEYPTYRNQLRECLGKFLQSYQQNNTDSHGSASSLLTPLNVEIVPLLEKYFQLEKEREELVAQELISDSTSSTSVRLSVCRLLQQTDSVTGTSEEVIASARSRLHSLCDSDPEEALLGIRDFFGVNDFKEAVEKLQSGEWHSQRNWKGIFATEQVKGRQASGGYMQPSHSHIPLFEETCRLLYRTHPDMLLTFVTFAQLARDYQALEDSAFARKCRKEFFYHRALLSLPAFVSPDLTPVSPDAVRVHSQLILCSGYPNAEMTSVELLLSNCLWEDAMSLVGQRKQESNHCALFHCLVSHMVKADVLYKHIDELWKLLPPNFSVFDFLSLLKCLKSDDSQLTPILTSDTLTVSSVAPRVLNLLKQSKLT